MTKILNTYLVVALWSPPVGLIGVGIGVLGVITSIYLRDKQFDAAEVMIDDQLWNAPGVVSQSDPQEH